MPSRDITLVPVASSSARLRNVPPVMSSGQRASERGVGFGHRFDRFQELGVGPAAECQLRGLGKHLALRSDAVDPYPGSSELLGQSVAEPVQSRLGGGVDGKGRSQAARSRRRAGSADVVICGGAREVDDPAGFVIQHAGEAA